MKKVITILMIMALLMSLSLVVSANEMEQGNNDELRAYIEERVVPVIIGVITSVVALLGSLKGVLSALKELKKAKDDFKETSAQMNEKSESNTKMLGVAYETIKDSVKNVPELVESVKKQDEKIEKLESAVVLATEILALAYSANSELVKTGKAKEMNRLLSKLDIKGDAQDEII